METLNNTQVAINAGRALGGIIKDFNGQQLVVVPDGYSVVSLDIHAEKPFRKRGGVRVTAVESFCEYVNDHKTQGTTIFVAATTSGLVANAVLNHHSKIEPGFGDHSVVFNSAQTVDWTRWMGKNGQHFNQVDFALHLENCQHFIVDPPGAELLEMVQSLEGKSKVRYSSINRLANGRVALDYEQDVELKGTPGGTKAGQVDFPQTIVCGLAPFEGIDLVQVHNRLRYRIGNDKSLVLWYEVINPHVIIKAATDKLAEIIAEKTKVKPLYGSI